MAKETRQIGVIFKAGPFYHARPTGQPGELFKTSGEARSYFRRFIGQETVFRPGQQAAQPKSLSFSGDLESDRKELVFLTANFTPAPPPPPPDVPPVTAGLVGYASRQGPFWQDLAKTVPATTPGDTVRVWETTNGDFVLTSGTPGTLVFGGGIQFPANGSAVYQNASWIATNVFSTYVSSSPPRITGDENVVICNAANQLTTWLQPFGVNGVMSLQVGGVNDATAGDLGWEDTRGMIANGTAVEWFSGDTLLDTGTLASGGFTGMQLGFSIPPFGFEGIVRAILLYDTAHTSGERTASQAFLNTINVPPATIDVVVSVHFEGDGALTGAPKTDMDLFQAAFPTVPLTMCMAPNDFFLGTAQPTVAARYSALLRPIDERAMHCHGQQPAIVAAGVAFRTVENFQSATVPNPDGYFEIVSSYDTAEWTTMATFFRNVFSSNGITAPTTFLAGGFMFDAQARVGIVAAGFTRDLSRVPVILVNQPYTSQGFTNLLTQLTVENASTTVTSQALVASGLTIVPSNGAVISYTNDGINCGVFNQNLQNARAGTPQVYQTGEHFGNMSIVGDLLDLLINYAAGHNTTLSFKRANQITA